MSLRAKLFLLCFISLGVVITPIIYFTYMDVRQTTSTMELATFDKMARLVEDNIGQRYLNLLAQRVMAVMQRKANLQKVALFARSLWHEISAPAVIRDEEKRLLARACMGRLRELGMSLEIIEPSGRMFPDGDDLGLSEGIRLGVTDFKGRPLAKIMTGDGEFAVLNLPQTNGTVEPVLVFFLQAPERQSVIITMLRIADLESTLDNSMRRLIEDTRNKLRTFDLYPNGFVTILNEQGAVLAHHGAAAGSRPELFPAEILSPPRQGEHVKYTGRMADIGEVLFSVLHFDAMDWIVVFAAPLNEIEAPSRALVKKLIYVALGGIILVLFLSMLAVAHLTRPLRLLAEKIRLLPDMDFASDEAENLLYKDLPVSRKDELGQVAVAFSRMGRRLSANIRDLMDATAIKERMQGELNAARDIQRSILPPPQGAPARPDFSAAAFLEPAKEVGGDLYDFFALPRGRQAVIIGDVSDKGVPAALFMSMTVTLVRNALLGGLDPARAMTGVNESLSANNTANMFVTLFIGVYDPATGHLEYANGGHCCPVIRSRRPDPDSGNHLVLREPDGLSGPVVGAMPGIDYAPLHERLDPGDMCFLYTDGVSEAINEQGDFFGSRRMSDVLEACGDAGPAAVLDAMYAAVTVFRGEAPQSDDITMLAFKAGAS
ncbi:MAG: SpoIIE family protein phosphatase [Desulfovibrio sp.]|jgi:sigma-B regulation protein RsbU (phosphoserine phosphatase)|nr:SpoIIE family protein phosphatase [Desulfovibrio sp.]